MNVDQQTMLPIGTMLRDTYRVEEYLASGGFGNTYVVTNVQFNERMALKEFFVKGINHREGQTTVSVSNGANRDDFNSQLNKFKKEACRLHEISNENIVRVHDLFEENGTAYYVMDLIDGESLSARMKRLGRPLTEAEVMALLPQVLNALDGIHTQQIWHLDLKPGNIMVDRQGRAVLIDFGASKQMDASQTHPYSTSIMPYTLRFAPPEQVDGNFKLIGPWSDFYALGATLYNLLTCNQPPSPSNILDEGVDALQFPPSVSDDMRQMIVWMMTTKPARRPQSVADIRQRIEQNASHDTVIHRHVPKPQKKKSGKVFATCGILFALFLLLGIGLGGFGWYYYQQSRYGILHADTPPSYSSQLLKLAEEGNADAQYHVGRCYYTGDGILQDFDEAAQWLRKAADQDHAEAQYLLGKCYYEGQGVSEDDDKAVYWFRKAADQDHVKAQYELGECYYYGFGVNTDKEKAVYWYRKAAEQGDDEAQFSMGFCYSNGLGVEEDNTEAVNWYQKAVAQGHAAAKYYLGLCYSRGHGVDEDYGKAVELWREAAEQGLAIAQNEMGDCYYHGLVVEENDEEAVRWYRKAAEQGLALGQYNLGYCYINGFGVEQDYAEAVKWYTKAAEKGNKNAQYGLAVCYDNGEGVARDYYKAAIWYRKAAEQGHASAQLNLGLCYYYGNGVGQDYAEAAKWFRMAAEQGNAKAQNNLGHCYYYGYGVGVDYTEALEWYRKAAAQGSEAAKQSLRDKYDYTIE